MLTLSGRILGLIVISLAFSCVGVRTSMFVRVGLSLARPVNHKIPGKFGILRDMLPVILSV